MNPQENQLFVFAYREQLSLEANRRLTGEISVFLSQWNSHGKSLHATALTMENRFLIIETSGSQPGGCSKDTLFRSLDEINRYLNLSLIKPSSFFLEINGEPCPISRKELQDGLRSGTISPETILFPTWISSAAEFAALWKKPLRFFPFLFPEKDLV